MDNVTFEVSRGTFFGCFGPNGAGKSSLIKILTGAVEPTLGSVRVLNKDVLKEGAHIRLRIGIVPESESPPSFLTVVEFLKFVTELHHCDNGDKAIDKWLDYFDLREKKDTLCKDLSKGMRQKIMLSAAFIHDPEILFLDEPFINLDPIYQSRLRTLLKEFVKEGKTIFMCSHILEIAEKLCDKVMVLNKGKVLAAGSFAELKQKENETLEQIFMRLVGKSD
ncbi:MAG: ABC transporter ATP-binding protein [Thermoplasmata archaeon]